MNWNQIHNHPKALHYIGLSLFSLGVIVWVFSVTEFVGNEIMLSNAQSLGLSMEEIWLYEGAFQWWKTAYESVVLPTSIILMASGTIVMLRLPLLGVMSKIGKKCRLIIFKEKMS